MQTENAQSVAVKDVANATLAGSHGKGLRSSLDWAGAIRFQ